MATFFNQATLTYSGGVVNSNITTGEIVEVLSVTKTAVGDTYTQGDEITYAVNIINSGTAPITGLAITDNLGAYTVGTQTLTPLTYIDGSVTVFEDGVLQPAPAVTAGAPFVITGIDVPANGVTTVLYTVRANEFASPVTGGEITNTAVISGGITPITATETITAAQEPALGIVKSSLPTPLPKTAS